MNKQQKKLSWILSFSTVGLATLAIGMSVSQPVLAGHSNAILHTMLSGSEEISDSGDPGVGDADGMGEAYVFGIDGDETTLCYALSVSAVEQVPVAEGMAAHIHEGAKGTNGPVVAALAGPEDGNAADCLTEGEEGKFPTGEMGIVQRILNSPEDFYVNVHNPQYPKGAVRGQLQSAQMHAAPMQSTPMQSAPIQSTY